MLVVCLKALEMRSKSHRKRRFPGHVRVRARAALGKELEQVRDIVDETLVLETCVLCSMELLALSSAAMRLGARVESCDQL